MADARYLPFPESTFDVVFSYSVLQHFEKQDARVALAEAARVLTVSGTSMIQLPNAFGLRNMLNQASDKDILPLAYKLVVNCSELLRGVSERLPFMKYWADSLYVSSSPTHR